VKRTHTPGPIPTLQMSRAPRQTPRDAIVTGLAAAADRAVMRTVALVVQRRLLPRDVDLDMLRDSVECMLDSGLAEDPDAFFLRPGRSKLAPATRSTVRRRLDDGRVFERRIHVAYREHPLMRDRSAAPDAQVHLQHWQHEQEAPRGTVIILHGFAMGWPAIDARVMSARHWFGLGMDVVLLTLPDHGPRRPPGKVFSGQNYTVPHAVRLAGAVHRAIHEIFEVKRWLRSVDDMPVGLVGMSLGGYLASLCAGLTEDLEFLVPLVPPACMGDLAWRVYRETSIHRAGFDDILTEANMRAAFYIHSPLAHSPRLDTERILIAAGAGDRIVPPEHPTALWEHWGRPSIHWFRGSHMAPAANKALVHVARAHLQRLAILPG